MKGTFPAGLLALSLLLPTPAVAVPDELVGSWMHVGEREGLVVGHLEVIHFEPSGAVTVEVYRNRQSDPGCEGLALWSEPGCANPQVSERALLQVDPEAGILSIDKRVAMPVFADPRDAEWWLVTRGAGDYPWTYRLEGIRLDLWREGMLEGDYRRFDRWYHRVDEPFPRDLFDALLAMEVSIVHAGCALDVILPDPVLSAEIYDTVARVARVSRALREARVTAAASGDPVDRQRRTELLLAVADAEATIPDGLDPADVAVTRELMAWRAADRAEANALMPSAVHLLPEIEACLERFWF